MSVQIKGVNKVLQELEKKYGKQKVQRVSDQALKAGAKVFVQELKAQFQGFKDTGESIKEITISEPFYEGKTRTVKIHWKGPEDRYRIIHLNEWGTVKNPNPRGKGAIAKAMRNAEKAYQNVIKEAIRRGM